MNGGEVEFVFTGNTDQLKEKFKDAEKGLLGLTDIAEQAGETLDNMIDGDILKNLKAMGLEVGKTGVELKKALKDADEFVKGMESGLKVVISEHDKLLVAINKMPEGNSRNILIEEYRAEAVEIEKVSQQITQYKEFLSNVKDESKSLTSKLREVTDEMKVLYDRGEQNSARYAELKEKAAEYREAQDAVNKQVQIASGPQGFNGLINALSFAAGGFSTVQGAIGLFGDESEDLNRVMLKVQSSLALVVGLQEIQKQVSAEGAFNITVLSRAKQIWAAANLRVATTLGISTVAAQALMATLTLGLSVAIVGVIALLDKASGKLKDTTEFNKKVADSIAGPIVAYRDLQNQWNALGSDLDKKKKFITDNQKAFEDLGFSVNNVGDAENFFVKKTNDVIQAMTLRAKAAASMEIATEKYKEALQAQMDYDSKMNTMKNGNLFEKIWTWKDANIGSYDHFGNLIQQQNEANQAANDALNKAFEFNQKEQSLYGNGLNKFTGKEKNEKTIKAKTAKQVAEEYLPEGSVAEIQRRLSKIDEALSKATNEGQISSLKAKRISIAEELAEAEKKIQIKTLQEQFDESEKLWQQYYNAVASIGKDKADEIYGDALKNDKASFEALEKQRADLLAKGNLTNEEKNYFSFIDDKINSMLGNQSRLDKFKQTIEETLSKLGSDTDKLNFIDQQKTTANKSTGEFAVLKDYENKIQEAQKQQYQAFLAAHQSFEEKKNAISKSYAELRQKIEADSSLNNEQRKNALEKAGQEEADAYSDAFMQELVNNPEYREAFADLHRQTIVRLQKLKKDIQKQLTDNKNLNPEAQASLRNQIKELDRAISEKNPYERLKNIIKDLGDESKTTAEKMEMISESADIVSEYINGVKGIVSDVTGALDDMGIQLDDATKDTIDNINQTLDGLGKMMEGTKEFAEGFMSGNVFKMVTGAVKYVAGAIKAISAWTNGDKKKERQIKAWADQVSNLKTHYQELEKAVSKALGEDKYAAQQNVINNLERQKILLQQMIQKEDAKKKTDQGKINGWKQEIADINAQISDLKKNIVDNILQTDAQGAAAKLGDALIEAFSKGEDGAKAMRDVANNMFKDIVKNALNMRLEKAMQPILNDMLKAIGYDESGNGSFVGLTKAQMEEFRQRIEAAGKFGQDFLNQYAELFQGLGVTTNGLKGDIKGVTEKTAGALEAQINAIRIYQVESLNLAKRNQQIFIDSLRHQAEIAYNTRELKAIRIGIDDLNYRLRRTLAGI